MPRIVDLHQARTVAQSDLMLIVQGGIAKTAPVSAVQESNASAQLSTIAAAFDAALAAFNAALE